MIDILSRISIAVCCLLSWEGGVVWSGEGIVRGRSSESLLACCLVVAMGLVEFLVTSMVRDVCRDDWRHRMYEKKKGQL